MNTALITTSGGEMLPAYQKIADPMVWCAEIGKAFHVTFGLTSPHHGTVMALTCLAENIPPTIYNQRYHGDGSMRASAIQAKFLERGGKIEWVNIGDDGKVASAKFTHPNQPNGVEIKYTIEDAAKQVGEKLNKPGSNWATNPGAMLRAALVRKAIKIIDPGIIGGFDSFNEFADQTPEPVKQVSAKKSQADRRKELEEETASQASEPIIDVEVDPLPNPAVVEITEPAPVADPEPAPFSTEPADTNDDHLPVTKELLQEIAKVGSKIPSVQNPGSGMSIQEISEGVCKACKVPKIQEATRGQIRNLIARFRSQLGEKS